MLVVLISSGARNQHLTNMESEGKSFLGREMSESDELGQCVNFSFGEILIFHIVFEFEFKFRLVRYLIGKTSLIRTSNGKLHSVHPQIKRNLC